MWTRELCTGQKHLGLRLALERQAADRIPLVLSLLFASLCLQKTEERALGLNISFLLVFLEF